MKVAIMQPTFNPWLGYFDLMEYVDKFIFLDTVQLTRRSWQVRNKIKVNGKEYMFSLPLKKEAKRDNAMICNIKLLEGIKIKKKLYQTLYLNYKKAKYFNEVNEFIKEIVLFDTAFLSEYNINIIKSISKKLQFNTEIITLSETSFNTKASKGELVLDICKYNNTTEYISPLGSKDYLDKELEEFKKNSIDIYYQYYQHPEYNQVGDEFIPYIGIFDLLYNEGFEHSKYIILSGRNYKKAEQ